MPSHVSEAVIKRLPSYYRYLIELENEGVTQISSQKLSERMNLTASQIRQDINCFGGFGRQGYGYSVTMLRQQMGIILGVHEKHPMIIIGCGNIGRAVALSDSIISHGFEPIALFDSDMEKVGQKVGTLAIRDIRSLTEFLQQRTDLIAVIAVPAHVAQGIADILKCHQVKGVWNFAPIDLHLPSEVSVVNVHLEEGLQLLSYKMKESIG